MATMKLKIDGMRCEHCVAHVREALASVAGVAVKTVGIGSAELELASGSARSRAIAAIEDEGYKVIGAA